MAQQEGGQSGQSQSEMSDAAMELATNAMTSIAEIGVDQIVQGGGRDPAASAGNLIGNIFSEQFNVASQQGAQIMEGDLLGAIRRVSVDTARLIAQTGAVPLDSDEQKQAFSRQVYGNAVKAYGVSRTKQRGDQGQMPQGDPMAQGGPMMPQGGPMGGQGGPMPQGGPMMPQGGGPGGLLGV